MRKELVAYRKSIDELIDTCPDGVDWNSAVQAHLARISFFQHERLIHLLVTLAFAFMTLASAIVAIATTQLLAGVLMLLFLVLLVPYIVHYYFLENETQKLYSQYDRLLEICQRNIRK